MVGYQVGGGGSENPSFVRGWGGTHEVDGHVYSFAGIPFVVLGGAGLHLAWPKVVARSLTNWFCDKEIPRGVREMTRPTRNAGSPRSVMR